MARYQKSPTVVDAEVVVAAGDYGVLGNLVTDDFIITLASGALETMSSADFHAKYTVASQNATLTGSDWD